MIVRLVSILGLVLLLAIGGVVAGSAGTASAQESPPGAPSPKVEELLKLLNDPEVRAWLDKAPAAAGAPETPAPETQLAMWDDAIRTHFVDLGAAMRRLPAELGDAMRRLAGEGRGIGIALLVLAVLVAIGFGVERLVARRMAGRLARMGGGDLASAALARIVPVLVFAATTLILLMFVGGSPLFRKMLVVFLGAIIAIRLVGAISGMISALLSFSRSMATPQAQQATGQDDAAAAATVTSDSAPAIAAGAAPSSVPAETVSDTPAEASEATVAITETVVEPPVAPDGQAAIAAPIEAATETVVAELPAAAEPAPPAVAVEAVPAETVAATGTTVDAAVVPAEADIEAAPTDERAARFWERRIVIFAGYYLMAWAILVSLRALGVSRDGVQFLTYLAGIGLVIIAVDAVWRGPKLAGGERSITRKWLLTLFLVVLWCVWAVGLNLTVWLGIYVLLLPQALSIAGRATSAALERRAVSGTPVSRVREVLFVRGARAVVVVLAVLWLGYQLRFNPGLLAGNDVLGGRMARVVLRSVVILLIADLIWQLAKTYIDVTISSSGIGPEDIAKRGRIRTLLPIFRNALAVLVATVAGLMVLNEFGVQVGPLIAGAGIFGVAIGFGSQTLVKDIVSGIFYLMDDAFRVGEYIQSGSYKGTVEGFSLRSVRLRHHRGPVFTVPFGTLGAIQNMSRDWSIDKFIIRLPFNTDIKLVKKLTKQVGAKLLEDPDVAPNIIETVKMKGVEQIGDYGIDISFSMMTKPGNQTAVRRRAYALLRDTFAAHDIEFARPSVNVGGDDNPAAAALLLAQKAKAEAEAAGA